MEKQQKEKLQKPNESEKITHLPELKPEILEMVMTKVQDINSRGTAFTDITLNLSYSIKIDEEIKKQLREILAYGLLGSIESTKPNPQNWKKYSRRKRQGVIFFNIVGRSCLEDYMYTGKSNRELIIKSISQILDDQLFIRNKKHIFIIIDISDYQEIWMPTDLELKNMGHRYHHPYDIPRKTHTFYADFIHKLPDSLQKKFGNNIPPPGSPELKEFAKTREGSIYLDEDGLPIPTVEFGFVLAHRIAPRKFKGIIIYIPPKNYITWKGLVPQPDPVILQKEIAGIVSLMIEANENRPQNLVPIYYINGDLLWPKQMSYQELKKWLETKNQNSSSQK